MLKYVGVVETSPEPVVICGFFGSKYPGKDTKQLWKITMLNG